MSGGAKALTAIFAAVMLAVPASGQPFRIVPREKLDSLANPVAAADSPMRFERTKIDAGTIGEDDAPSKYTFLWHNDGDEPLVVTEVRTGCGCAVAEYDRRPVKAGEDGAITVTYHPKGHPGYFLRKISVYTQRSKMPSAVLELSGRVVPSVRPVHNYPHAMGSLLLKQMQVRIDRSQRSIESIEVLNGGDEPLQITVESRLLPEYVTVKCLPERLEAGATGDIEISFDPSKVRGALPDRVPVILNGVNLPPSRRTIYVNFE